MFILHFEYGYSNMENKKKNNRVYKKQRAINVKERYLDDQ